MKRKLLLIALVFLGLVVLSYRADSGENGSGSTVGSGPEGEEAGGELFSDETGRRDLPLFVDFLDVGEGDAALLTCGEHAVLIDGGGRSTSSFVVAYLSAHGVEKLDYLILTHFDEDHIAGAIGVLYTTEVTCVLQPDYETDTAIYRSLRKAEEAAAAAVLTPSPGGRYEFGDAELSVLAPRSYTHEKENDNSICLMVSYGADRILFTGDAESGEEAELLNNAELLRDELSGTGSGIRADLLKVAHHGSRTSSSDAFLAAVRPAYAVISCGDGNPYGHPSQDVLDRLSAADIQVLRTDELGTIRFVSRGDGIAPAENDRDREDRISPAEEE